MMWVRLAAIALSSCVGFISQQALAQPTSAEVLQVDPFSPGWAGGVDANFALSRGNVELLDLGAASRIQFQTLYAKRAEAPPAAPPFIRQRVLSVASFRFAERDSSPFINQGFAHLRWTNMWWRRLGSDVFAQYQFDDFQRLLARAVAGVGPRVAIIHQGPVLLWAGSAYMLEIEHVDVATSAEDEPRTVHHRWSNFVTARVALFGERLLAQNTIYMQPRFERFADYRLLNECALQAQVRKALAIGLALSIAHDSKPPTDVEETDLRLTNTLHISF